MKPYYTSPDGTIVVYHARWEDVLAAGLIVPAEVALVHADPPTGDGLSDTRRNGCGEDGDRSRPVIVAGKVRGHGRTRMFSPIVGDFEPFDPRPLLTLERPTVIWCAMHFAQLLPPSKSWLVWDKREGRGQDDNADGELAWANLGGCLRTFHHWWRGALRKTEKLDKHLHPTQKPIALCSWVYQRAKLKRGDLVFVPYMGSGPDLAACVAMGLRCIACEVDEEYCRVAVGARLHAAPVVESVGPLFGGA